MIKNSQKSIKEGIQEYDEITKRNNQLIKDFVDSNQVDSSFVKIVSNLLNTRSQFRLEPAEINPNLFIVNSTTNPQLVQIKGSTITPRMVTHSVNNQDLSYFINSTQIDKEIQNLNLIIFLMI